MRHHGGNPLKSQDHRERLRTSPLNPVECVIFGESHLTGLEAEVKVLT
jgi:hypothetical protein